MTIRSIQLLRPPLKFSLTLRKQGERNTIDVFTRKGGQLVTIVKALTSTPSLPLPPSPLPESSSSNLVELYADADIGGHRVVVSIGTDRCEYADHTNASHSGKVVGITAAAASRDSLARINTSGVVDEQSWNWIPGEDVWVIEDGMMSQIPPMDGVFIQRIGYALSSTRIRVTLDDSIFL